MTVQLRAQLVSPAVEGSLNPAYFEMSFADLATSGLTQEQLAAQFLAYVINGSLASAHAGVYLVGCDFRAAPTDPYMPMPFPYVEYADVVADYGDTVHVPAMSAYNTVDIGYTGFTSSGRGDSLCISYRSTAPGRSSKGRNFWPFLARQAIATTGLIDSSNALVIELGFDTLLNGAGTGVLAQSTFPEVYSKKLTTGYPIVSYTVAQVPSRLRSRTK